MPILSLFELESEISQGRFRLVYLFLGPEEYLIRQALAQLKEKALTAEARAFNFTEHSGDEGQIAEIVKSANTFPMLSPRRLVLVTEVEKLYEQDQEKLVAYAADPQKRTVLVLVAGDLDRRGKLYRRLSEFAAVVEFSKLKGAALERWADNFVSRRGFRISTIGLKKLLDLAASDLLALTNELEKLMLYAGNTKQIPDAAVDELVQTCRHHRIYELTGALGRRDRKAALRSLGNLLEAGEDPLGIVGLMAKHFRQVMQATELLAEGRTAQEIGRAVQIPDFAQAEFLRQVQTMNPEIARNAYERLARIDRSFKSTNPDQRMLLEHLICSL